MANHVHLKASLGRSVLGRGQTCAISSVGHVVCWGYAGGNSNTVRSSPPGTFLHVTVGNSYACGLRTSGAVVCWPNKIWDPDDNETQLPAELKPHGGRPSASRRAACIGCLRHTGCQLVREQPLRGDRCPGRGADRWDDSGQ